MTRAPDNLMAVRALLLAHLNVDPDTARSVDLEPGEVGIVGDPAHRGGYHCGSDRVVTNDYSVVESSRDRNGLSDYAAGLDVGHFSVTVGGRTHNLRTFSTWCAGECAKGAPDTLDIREIIYSPDGETVKRWDRLKRRASGDDSHIYHTHFSYFRDSRGRDQRPLFRRYLTTIGLLEDDDMTPDQDGRLKRVEDMLLNLDGREAVGMAYLRLAEGKDHREDATPVTHPSLKSLGGQLSAIQAAMAKLAGQDFTDEAAIVRGVLAGLTPEAIAAAIPPAQAKAVADELAARMAS